MRVEMKLPPGNKARLGITHELAGSYFVFVGTDPGMHLLDRRGELIVMLTHEADVAWPDREALDLAEAVLAQGGSAILQFPRLADAMKCHRRIVGSSAH